MEEKQEEKMNLPIRQLNNIIFPSDTAGTGFFRFLMPTYTLWSGPENLPKVSVMHQLPLYPQFFENVDSVMVQRLIDKHQLEYIKFLKQISKINGMRIIYNIDDAMGADDIPVWNRGRRAFLPKERQEAIKEMLQLADEVLVTTDYLKTYYNREYDVPLDNIVAVPNLLPRWWIDSKLDIDKKVESFKSRKKGGKINVGIVSSLSHYNIDGIRKNAEGKCVFTDRLPDGKVLRHIDENGTQISEEEFNKLPLAEDEMSEIADLIEKTVDVFNWTVVGWVPEKLSKLAADKKIRLVASAPILNYPHMVKMLDLDVWVVPCRPDLEFNKCKSNIKWLEACALGIPMLAQKVKPTYTKYMPEDQLWENVDQLKDKLLDISTWSVEKFKTTVQNQRKFIDSPFKECGIELRNWWLEDNLDVWAKIWAVPQKMTEAKAKAIEEMKRKMNPPPEDIIFKSKSGECMIVK